MATIVATVRISWDEETEGPPEEFLTTITDSTAVVETSGYSLSGPATYIVEA